MNIGPSTRGGMSRAQRFARLDQNGDGVRTRGFDKAISGEMARLSKTELQTLADKISQKTGQTITADDLLAKMDKNGDGSIAMNEMRGPRRGRPPRPDQDGDGVLSDTELQTLADKISQKTGQTVTADDLKGMMDADGDGTVTAAEAKQARQAHRGQQPDAVFEAVSENAAIPKDVLDNFAKEISQNTGRVLNGDQLASRLDRDGDGQVSQSELNQAMRAMHQARMRNM